MPETEFSVIIPTRNEAEGIEPCLQSVLAAGGADVEVIVVDGGSTDGTLEILRRYAASGRVRLISENAEPSVARARNLAAAQASGDVLVFVNADNLLGSDFFQRIRRHYDEGACFVVGDSRVANTERLLPRYVQARHMEYRDGTLGGLWSEGFSCRREAFHSVGGFPPFPGGSAAEDTTLGLRLRCHFPTGGRIDREIVVRHVADADPAVFLRKRLGRGKGRYHFDRTSGSPRWRLFGRSYGRLLLLAASLRFRRFGAITLGGALAWWLGCAIREGVALSRWQNGREKLPLVAVSLADSTCRKTGYLVALAQSLFTSAEPDYGIEGDRPRPAPGDLPPECDGTTDSGGHKTVR